MFKKKIILFFIVMAILILSFDIVVACENSTQITTNETNNCITNEKTFKDIQIAINNANENDIVELEGTYISKGNEIQINKSITLTSKNGAILNAQSNSNILNISNGNVCLENLSFINAKSNTISAIYSSGNLTIINSNFNNNTVEIQNILPIYSQTTDNIEESAGAIFSENNLHIINCEFIDNYATRRALFLEYPGEDLITWGGAIRSKGNLIIEKSKINDKINSLGMLTILNSTFNSTGIICNNNTTIINSTFTKTQDFDSAITPYYDLVIQNCNFTNNGGYVIYCEENIETLNKITIQNCNFINNNLKCADCHDYDSEFTTIFVRSINTYIYNSNFMNNTARTIDGTHGQVFIYNSSFINNEAAITSENATVENSIFTNNTARVGGAIYCDYLNLTNSTFSNNQEGAIYTSKFASINGNNFTKTNTFNNSLEKIELFKMTVGKLSTIYQSGKTLSIQLIYTDSKDPYDGNIDIKVVKGKKVHYYDKNTNSKGISTFKLSYLPVGTYKVIINYYNENLPQKTITIKVTKAKTNVKAPKVTNKYKKSKYFKITVKHKTTKKAVKNTYIKIKIDKKTYKVKTNSKGIAKFNTKNLKIGKHKVVVSSGNTNYQMSAKSTITIKR